MYPKYKLYNFFVIIFSCLLLLFLIELFILQKPIKQGKAISNKQRIIIPFTKIQQKIIKE